MAGENTKTQQHGANQRHESRKGRGSRDDRNNPKPGGLGVTLTTASEPSLSKQAHDDCPDQAVSLQTSQVSDSISTDPYDTASGVIEERRDAAEDEQPDPRGAAKSRTGMNKRTPKSGKADEPEQICVSKEWMPGNWKRLLVTCVLALACGIGGAWVYTALSGSSSSERGSKGSNQADKSSQAGEGNKKSDNQSGGKSAVGQGADSSQNSATVSKAAGLGSSEGAETATKDAWLDANLEHLSHRIDVLGKRLSKMTLPEQESPAVLHTLQMQMTDLENDFEQVAGLPAKIQQLERDVASFKEDLTVLKANLPREALSPNQNP